MFKQHSIITKESYDKTLYSKMYAPHKIPRHTGLKFGMELEAENAPMFTPEDYQTIAGWTVKDDGSLRNRGVEFVTTTPEDYDQALKSLNNLDKVLKKHRFDFSERTSFHVHVNIGDMSLKNFHVFLTLYSLIEPLLIRRAGGQARVANHFCLGLSDANDVKDLWLDSFQELGNFVGIFRVEKYAALNLSSFRTFSTMEFRAHRGTADVNEFKLLLSVLKEMYEACNKIKHPFDIFYSMSELGFEAYFRDLLPKTMEYVRWMYPNFEKAIMPNFLFAQALASKCQIVEKVAEPQNKPRGNKVKAFVLDELIPQPAPRFHAQEDNGGAW